MPSSTPTTRDEAATGMAPQAAIRGALASLSLSILLSSLGTSIANIALPTLAQAFAAPFQHVQWVVLAYLLAVTTLIVSVGRLGDILGRRQLLLIGLALFTAASALCGLAPSLWLLIAARAAQGLGAAIMMALSMAFVSETVPKEKTGSAMGLLGTMSAIGTALGPSLGGILIAEFGWRAIFFAIAALGPLAWFLAWRFLPAEGQAAKTRCTRFDGLGTLLLAGALAAYALAMTLGHGQFGRLNAMLLLVSVLACALFVTAEAKVPSPLIRSAAFRDPGLSASLAMNALVSTVMMATLIVGPFYLSQALGLNEALVGGVMSIGPLTSALSGVVAGRIVDRCGSSLVVTVGLVEMAMGAIALFVLPPFLGVAGYIIAILVLTPGYQLFQAANNTAVMMDVPSDGRGVISGMLNLARNLGLITGASVMGAIFAAASGTSDISVARPDAVTTGMQVTFAVAALLLGIALAVAAAGSVLTTRRLPAE